MLESLRRPSRLFSLAILLAASSADGQIIETIAGAPNYQNAPALERPIYPRGVAIGPDGKTYFTDSAGSRVLRYDPATGTVTSLAGTGRLGFSGDGGPAASATLSDPRALAIDSAGNLYIADGSNLRVRKIDAATSIISTVAGGGSPTIQGDGGDARFASFQDLSGLAVDPVGNLYISDDFAQRVREVSAATGIITTIAGNGTQGYSGDGGPAAGASFSRPCGIALDSAGNVYISDQGNFRVRRIAADTGMVTTFAGTGTQGFGSDAVPATQSELAGPAGLTFDSVGNLYISDQGSMRIRRVAADTGLITTMVGGLNAPDGLAVDTAGAIYIAEWQSYRIRRYDPSTQLLSTVAGNGTVGFCGDGQPALGACVYDPQGVAVDAAGNIYISDTGNSRIRRIAADTGIMTTIAGNGTAGRPTEGAQAISTPLFYPRGIALDPAGNLFVMDGLDIVRRVDAASGVLTTVAGGAAFGFCGDGGPATSACLRNAQSLAFDSAGNLYIADTDNMRVRRVDVSTGVITTVAGNGSNQGELGDGGPATAASLFTPSGIAVDANGNPIISDVNHRRIRKVDASTGLISTIAGNGTIGFGGDGGSAVDSIVDTVWQLALDGSGNLFFTDDNRIRRIDAQTGIVSTVAGNGQQNFSGDGGAPTAASLNGPRGVTIDGRGNILIADSYNSRIRLVGVPVDRTPPTVTISMPANGATYSLLADLRAQYACTDDISGVATCTGSVPNGVRVDTSSPGSHTFTVNASDAAGNSTSVTSCYVPR
jgi:sugar lactone lactonase YvrE